MAAMFHSCQISQFKALNFQKCIIRSLLLSDESLIMNKQIKFLAQSSDKFQLWKNFDFDILNFSILSLATVIKALFA